MSRPLRPRGGFGLAAKYLGPSALRDMASPPRAADRTAIRRPYIVGRPSKVFSSFRSLHHRISSCVAADTHGLGGTRIQRLGVLPDRSGACAARRQPGREETPQRLRSRGSRLLFCIMDMVNIYRRMMVFHSHRMERTTTAGIPGNIRPKSSLVSGVVGAGMAVKRHPSPSNQFARGIVAEVREEPPIFQ